MNILELFCDVEVTKELTEDMRYDFWSVTSDNDIILMRVKDSIPWVPKYRISKYDVARRLFSNAYDSEISTYVR